MSFASIRTYLNANLPTVDSDLKEWTDGFNTENIPETILHKAYHITFNPTVPVSVNQNCFQVDYPVTLNVFWVAGLDVSSAIDSVNVLGQSIYQELLKHSNRLGISGTSTARTVNIIPGAMSINQLNADNDNSIRLQMEFNFKMYLELS